MTDKDPLVRFLLETLGLSDLHVRRLVLDIQVDAPVLVTVEEYVRTPDGGTVVPLDVRARQYRLCAKDSERAADTLHDDNIGDC